MKFLFLIQARSTSTRFPKKVLQHITGGKTLIETVYARVLLAEEETHNTTTVLIPDRKSNDQLASFLKKKKISYYRGSEENVYLRFFNFLYTQKIKPDYVFRICSDNPFIEPIFIKKIITTLEKSKNLPDYISFKNSKGKPAILTHSGFFCEAIKYDTFMKAKKEIASDAQKMHVTPLFYTKKKFKTKFLPMPFIPQYVRCTVDTKEDFDLIKNIYRSIKNKKVFSYKDIISILRKNPKYIAIMKKSIEKNKK